MECRSCAITNHQQSQQIAFPKLYDYNQIENGLEHLYTVMDVLTSIKNIPLYVSILSI